MRILLALSMFGCSKSAPVSGSPETSDLLAHVTEVEVRGDEGAYTFLVTISSDELGCDRYANWWEVVGTDGALLHRRVLGHSHVEDQPFTRSGGPVAIDADTEVWVRAHMAPGGYGGMAFFGSAASGFTAATPPEDWANLATMEPLPTGCAH